MTKITESDQLVVQDDLPSTSVNTESENEFSLIFSKTACEKSHRDQCMVICICCLRKTEEKRPRILAKDEFSENRSFPL